MSQPIPYRIGTSANPPPVATNPLRRIRLPHTPAAGALTVTVDHVVAALTYAIGGAVQGKFYMSRALFWGKDEVDSASTITVTEAVDKVAFEDTGTIGKERPHLGIEFPINKRKVYTLIGDSTPLFFISSSVELVYFDIVYWSA